MNLFETVLNTSVQSRALCESDRWGAATSNYPFECRRHLHVVSALRPLTESGSLPQDWHMYYVFRRPHILYEIADWFSTQWLATKVPSETDTRLCQNMDWVNHRVWAIFIISTESNSFAISSSVDYYDDGDYAAFAVAALYYRVDRRGSIGHRSLHAVYSNLLQSHWLIVDGGYSGWLVEGNVHCREG